MVQPSLWTIASILKWTTQYFEKHTINTPRLDAELLLAKVLDCDRLSLYLNADQPVQEEDRKSYRELIQRRLDGAPVAYLLGRREFWSMQLRVEPGVLIPRPDTETLVEAVCVQIKKWQTQHPEEPCWILELGTGSGAIPLALCAECQNLRILSTDISAIAIKTAAYNLSQHTPSLAERQNEVLLIQGDRLEMIGADSRFNFLISNPPYVPSNAIPMLQKEIFIYEPIEALDGGDDGLCFYRYLFEKGSTWLKEESQLFFEIGSDQEDALRALAKSHSIWVLEEVILDIQSLPRVMRFRKHF